MKIAFINASPKKGASNSGFLLEKLKEQMESGVEQFDYLFRTRHISEEACEKLFQVDVWVVAFPLYVDAVPSHFLYVMEVLESYGRHIQCEKPRVYVCINNGFYEGNQNAVVFDIMKNWCNRCGLYFGGGIAHGAGEMLGSLQGVPVGKGPLKNLGNGLNRLIQSIEKGNEEIGVFMNPNFPRFIWKFMATHSFWKANAKKNGLSQKDMYKQW